MFDMMLGPLGETYWRGPAALPRAQLHHDWSRVAFPAGASVAALDAFSYGTATQGPAAIFAAIGAVQANIQDTSLAHPDALSRDCIATHLGVQIENRCLVIGGPGADTILVAADLRELTSRVVVRVFYAERSNEEFVGIIEDLPSGKGIKTYETTAAPAAGPQANGLPVFSNVRPLPQPLPCEGGKTYFRVSFEPTPLPNAAAAPGITLTVICGIRADVYGIMPPRTAPTEAAQVALQTLARLR